MFRKLIIVVLAILVLNVPAMAVEIEDIIMPDVMESNEIKLNLNGVGVRSKFFMDLYVGGLYLEKKEQDPQKIIDADEPMAIRLHIISSLISSEKMENATREGFENATNKNIAPIQEQIEQFIAVFKIKIEKMDTYHFIHIPGKGMEIYKNDKLKTLIEGLEFKKALFGIWLCDKPAQKSLKKKMLGK